MASHNCLDLPDTCSRVLGYARVYVRLAGGMGGARGGEGNEAKEEGTRSSSALAVAVASLLRPPGEVARRRGAVEKEDESREERQENEETVMALDVSWVKKERETDGVDEVGTKADSREDDETRETYEKTQGKANEEGTEGLARGREGREGGHTHTHRDTHTQELAEVETRKQ